MAKFHDPAEAFKPSGQTVQRKGATLMLHQVAPALRGFEIVVASSNNKAVENVSAELPAMDAVATDTPGLRYFKSISDQLADRETWGAIAAVLGNSANRSTFAEKFWRDEENGLATYLNHAAGNPQYAVERTPSGETVKRLRNVVKAEAPPQDRREALCRWKTAREAFAVALAKAWKTREGLDAGHRALVELPKLEADLATQYERELEIECELSAAMSHYNQCTANRNAAHKFQTGTGVALSRHEAERPGFIARLLGFRSARDWTTRLDVLRRENANASSAAQEAEAAHSDALRQVEDLGDQLRRLREEERALHAACCRHRATLRVLLAQAKPSIPDDGFFAQVHETRQTTTLWFDRHAQLERDHVFEAAIALHRAFVDAAADQLRQNLAVFTETFGARSLGTAAKDQLVEDLWATFFLVVPVISTTFASVERMFSRVGPEAIGWLLVDEAGQAVPQAAVGSLMRARRAVVVGDPLQIEPVVVLPNTLTEEICSQFGVTSIRFNAPGASVQTMADAASPLCGRFSAGSGYRDVGSPLLVHRRCDSPMFDISNSIAYANLMVQAKSVSTAQPRLGPSRWIDIRGQADQDKWSVAEGTEVVAQLQRLKEAEAEPDVYVVTPFVVVQDNLRRLLVESGVLSGWVKEPKDWVWSNVGTVHTVQGREAETVMFVLGAQAPSQRGAREWAGMSPNLLNVAVSRAKSALYVIGNRELWSHAGVFRELSRLIG